MPLLASSVVVQTAGGFVKRRRGYPDQPLVTTAPTDFTVGTTRPTLVNTGPDTLPRTAYAGTSAGAQLNITTAGTTFDHVDFGNTRVRVNAPNVSFINCTWNLTTWASNAAGWPAIDCRPLGGSNTQIIRCDINNACQYAVNAIGVVGDRFTLTRSRVRNFTDQVNVYPDASNIDGPVNVQILGNYLTDLAFFWAPTTGVVHPSDTITHNDVIQHQGGRGIVIRGNYVGAYYSAVVGTGTPRSGSEFGWAVPYTQAQGEAERQRVAYGNGAIPSGLGGSVTGLMFNNDRGGVPAAVIDRNWGAGGSYWLNAGEVWTTAAGVTYNFGTITGNVIKRDQRVTSGGLPVVFGINTSGAADVRNNVQANDDWTPTTTAIARQNA